MSWFPQERKKASRMLSCASVTKERPAVQMTLDRNRRRSAADEVVALIITTVHSANIVPVGDARTLNAYVVIETSSSKRRAVSKNNDALLWEDILKVELSAEDSHIYLRVYANGDDSTPIAVAEVLVESIASPVRRNVPVNGQSGCITATFVHIGADGLIPC
eukprot:Opistho-2@62048